jgi:transmembrane sensor
MKQNYNTIQDFLNNDSFVQWVLFQENNFFWEQFLMDYPMKAGLMDEAHQLILEINEIEGRQVLELEEERVWNRISKNIHSNEVIEKPKRSLLRKTVLSCVAGIIVMLGIGSIVWNNQQIGDVCYEDLVASIGDKSAFVEKINLNDTPLKVVLEDGSVITLEKNSKLSFPMHFDKDKRTVILSGDAFFQIAKNPNKPFYVYANEIVTKVLGTSFRIQAFDKEKKVLVKVRTGKVSVYNQRSVNLSDPETNGLVLMPNQQATYSRSDKNLSKSLVQAPLPLQDMLPVQFDEVAISDVFDVIEKRYGVKIIYNEEVLADCYITTKLMDKSLYNELDLICGIIGGTYKEVDAQIVIESQGCN